MRLIFLWLLVTTCIFSTDDVERQQILLRIQPIGQVNIEGDAPALTTKTSAPVKKKLVPGQAVYEQHCSTCHRDGLANAPKFQNKQDWEPRLAKQTIDELLATAIKGLNAMPPKGTCSECSTDDLKQAIQYMLPRS